MKKIKIIIVVVMRKKYSLIFTWAIINNTVTALVYNIGIKLQYHVIFLYIGTYFVINFDPICEIYLISILYFYFIHNT